MARVCNRCYNMVDEDERVCPRCKGTNFKIVHHRQGAALTCPRCNTHHQVRNEEILTATCTACHHKLYPTYYDILELDVDATDKEIKKQYRKLAMKWHPDKNKGSEEEANERFLQINQVYDILSNVRARNEYNQFLQEELENLKEPDYNLEEKLQEDIQRNMVNRDEMMHHQRHEILAQTLAFQNYTEEEIVEELVEKGVREEVAEELASKQVQYRIQKAKVEAKKHFVPTLVKIGVALLLAALLFALDFLLDFEKIAHIPYVHYVFIAPLIVVPFLLFRFAKVVHYYRKGEVLRKK